MTLEQGFKNQNFKFREAGSGTLTSKFCFLKLQYCFIIGFSKLLKLPSCMKTEQLYRLVELLADGIGNCARPRKRILDHKLRVHETYWDEHYQGIVILRSQYHSLRKLQLYFKGSRMKIQAGSHLGQTWDSRLDWLQPSSCFTCVSKTILSLIC